MNKLDSTRKYLFLGLPGSGKTTCLALMLKELQIAGNISEEYNIRFMSEKNRDPKSGLPTYDYKTSNYIENIIALLSQKKWPNPTREFIECNIRYTCVEDTCAGRVNKKYDIEIIDCPGDYFEAAFCSEASQSDHLLQKANQLKEMIRNCNHVCYFIDANTLFSGIETSHLRQSMEGLFEYMLNDLSDHVGLTILLNKGEGIEESYPEVLSLLKLKYSNAYQLMKNKLDDCNSSYLLRPLSTFSFDEKRNAISLKEKESHDFLAPFNFTLGLDHYFITWVKERRLRREQEEKEQKENEKRLFERGLNKGVFLMKQNTWTTLFNNSSSLKGRSYTSFGPCPVRRNA